MDLCIRGGTIHDPANGRDGVVDDIWIDAGRIVAPPVNCSQQATKTIDARGLIVMPGGVDMHAHIAGPVVNAARAMAPNGPLPNTRATGSLYTALGYTTVVDPAITPLGARQALLEFDDTPLIDKAMLLSLGDHQFVLEQVAKNDQNRLRGFVGWILNSVKGYGVKLVNPGATEAWKQSSQLADLDAKGPFGCSTRQILSAMTLAVNELRLPHAVHIHTPQLGLPGNCEVTADCFRTVEGSRAHFTHIQFHSYTGDANDSLSIGSDVAKLAAYVNTHREISVDVGQVMFGEAMGLTGDGPLGEFLHRATGRPWTSRDVEVEGGCGIVPITYRDKSLFHAMQWAIGLEWFLLVDDPWRVAMSTDHPNGAAFIAYPEIIQSLMSRDVRREVLDRLPEKIRERSVLGQLEREYTLNEIAIITRAGPARILGMKHKGQLGIGADADVTIYSQNADRRLMFSLPKYVIKAGQLVAEDGVVTSMPCGKLMHAQPSFDEGFDRGYRSWFDSHYSIQFENFKIKAEDVRSELAAIPPSA